MLNSTGLRTKKTLRTIFTDLGRNPIALARRIAYRCRAFLTSPVLSYLVHAHVDQLRESNNAVLSLVENLTTENRALSVALHQAMQASRETIRDDLSSYSEQLAEFRSKWDAEHLGQQRAGSASIHAQRTGSPIGTAIEGESQLEEANRMKQGIVVVGAGGHAKVCIDILQQAGERVDFCIGATDAEALCAGVHVLRGDDHLIALRDQGYTRAFIAIGSNALRAKLADVALTHGYILATAIHPRAFVAPTVQIGAGVAIMANAVINPDCIIGDLCIVNTGAVIDHDARIGRAVHIAPQVGLAGNVRVGDNSFLGIGAKVIPEMTIGCGATVGAGAVVISDVAHDVTVVGVPARPIFSKSKQ